MLRRRLIKHSHLVHSQSRPLHHPLLLQQLLLLLLLLRLAQGRDSISQLLIDLVIVLRLEKERKRVRRRGGGGGGKGGRKKERKKGLERKRKRTAWTSMVSDLSFLRVSSYNSLIINLHFINLRKSLFPKTFKSLKHILISSVVSGWFKNTFC